MKRCLLLLCACLFGILAFAQEDPVLMRVNGREVSRSEFEYSYHHYRAGEGRELSPKEYAPVSYTHLDVYKRQEDDSGEYQEYPLYLWRCF